MQKRRPRQGSVVLVVLVLLAGLLPQTAAYASFDQPALTRSLTRLKPARPAPDFTLPDLDGKWHRLSDYRGKVVLINFWATWCPPCRREMPSMERLRQRLKDEPFVILAVDQQESEETALSFIISLDPGPTYPILMDSDSLVSESFRVAGLPTSFILDAQGRIVYRAIGGREFDDPDIERRIRELLKARPAR